AGKVNKDAKGVLENTMVQTNGDVEYKTNTVENPIKVPVTNWVDENGKHLKDQEEGSFPDRDGNDIPGYQLVKIDEDEDGNVTNVYKKVPEKPETPAPTPSTPAQPAQGTPATPTKAVYSNGPVQAVVPQKAAKEVPATPEALPQTGDEGNGPLALVAGAAAAALGMFGLGYRKRRED
ncbi:LPXTG cell wall anchor domain-containing protein, partial [Ligilactobacillus equi]